MSESIETVSYVGTPQLEVRARRSATRLRNVLRLNSAFSASAGGVGLIAAVPLADFLGVEQAWIVRLVCAGLVGFAVITFGIAGTRTSALTSRSQIVTLNDLGWVLATIATVGLGWLSPRGVAVMSVVGLAVLALGIAQTRARSVLIAAAEDTDAELDELPPIEILQYSEPSTNTVEELWPVMTDHQLYAELALNLKAAEGLTPNGPGFRRSCTDTLGRSWSETCTLWEPGRRFDVNVDINEYPYPLQLVQGSWQVDRVAGGTTSGSTIGMTFAIQPRPGLYGRVFVSAMHVFFVPILRRITKGWNKAASK